MLPDGAATSKRSTRSSGVPVTWTTADRFGRILADLRRKVRTIPTKDVWIAAQAMESGAELVSFDPHLRQVDALAWTERT